MIDKDYYQILHVNEDATLEEIRQARNLLLQQFHPDKISRDLKEKGSEYFTVIAQEINEAFKVLSNPVKRAEYDFQRKNGKIPPPSAAPNPVVSPLTLNFGKVTRGSISKLIFKFENTGGAIQEINFSYSEDGGWFKIANTESPDFPRLVEVTSDTHSLTKGENYNGWIDINCDGIVVRVNLEVQIDDTPETNESYKPSITVLKQTPMWVITSIVLIGVIFSGWMASVSFGWLPGKATAPSLPIPQLPSSTPVPLVPSGQIVFSKMQNGQQILNIVNADSTNQRSLNVAGWSPLWSPDARQIAFISDRAGGVQQVYLIKSEGGSLTRLTDISGDKSSLFWSERGNLLMFVVTQQNKSTLYSVDLLGLKVQPVMDEQIGIIKQINWSPDKKWLLFDVQSRDGSRVYRFNVETKQEPQLTDFDSWQPAWSPDGKEIVVASQDGIYKMDENGQKRLRLTTFLAWSPTWSADARYLAFLSDKGLKEQAPELWFMEADGSNMKSLTTTGCWGYVWAKENLIYITGDNSSQPPSLQIWVLNLPTDHRTKLAELNQPDISWIP